MNTYHSSSSAILPSPPSASVNPRPRPVRCCSRGTLRRLGWREGHSCASSDRILHWNNTYDVRMRLCPNLNPPRKESSLHATKFESLCSKIVKQYRHLPNLTLPRNTNWTHSTDDQDIFILITCQSNISFSFRNVYKKYYNTMMANKNLTQLTYRVIFPTKYFRGWVFLNPL